MPRFPDGLGRTIFIALLAGVMFAGFLLVTPRLTAASRDADPTPTTLDTSTTTAATPTTTAPVTTTTVTTTTLPPTTTTAALPEEEGYDGRLALTIETASEGHGKNEIFDGDEVRWRFQIENLAGETLWGVFVYLELHGQAPCDQHILAAGESTECWLTTRATEGVHMVEAWANAWTTEEMVKDKVFLDLVVLP